MSRKLHILISEDEKLNFLLLKKLLEKILKHQDVNIVHATNGEEAVALCTDDINLVLMDIEMPKMDGFEVSTILKEKYPQLPIIMQTAHCTSLHKQKAEEIGCDGFLPKPIIRKDFELILNQFLLTAS